MLESKSKFNWHRPQTSDVGSTVNVEKFQQWSNNNMYRTSYTDMSTKVRQSFKQITEYWYQTDPLN